MMKTGFTMAQEEKKYYSIGAISKACAVLEMLSTKPAFELAELYKALEMPKTTVHRILLTLCDEGYVHQNERGGLYALTYKLFSLGRRVINSHNIVDAAKPYVTALLEQFDETVNLCVISGTTMLIIDKQSTSQALRPDNIVGTFFAVFYSASGKAYLAFSSEAKRAELLEKIRLETRPVISDQMYEVFLQELEDTKKTGIAYDNEEIYAGVRCIAVPIFDCDNNPIAAFSISAPSIRLHNKNIERFEMALLESAKNLSLQLGSTHPLYN